MLRRLTGSPMRFPNGALCAAKARKAARRTVAGTAALRLLNIAFRRFVFILDAANLEFLLFRGLCEDNCCGSRDKAFG